MEKQNKLSVLAVIPEIIPSTKILIITPLLSLHKQKKINLKIKLEDSVKLRDFSQVDVVVFSRNISLICNEWLDFLSKNEIPFIYDIDDNFFDIPIDYSKFAEYVRSPQSQFVLKKFVNQACLVRVYAREMQQRVKGFTDNVALVSGPIDWDIISPIKKKKNKDIKILYATSRIADDKLSMIFEAALIEIIEKYKDSVNVYFWGFHPKYNKNYSNIHYLHFEENYSKYLHKLSKSGFDIGLVPLIDDTFHRSKSNIKYREYAACHIAGVYSNVATYTKDVTNYLNGILVENKKENWIDAISKLIENEKLLNTIKENAFSHARQNYSQTDFENQWLQDINVAFSAQPRSVFYENSDDIFRNTAQTDSIVEENIYNRFYSMCRENGIIDVIYRLKNKLNKKLYFLFIQLTIRKNSN